MFDFMDSDWFVIGLEVLFLSFIAYDGWKFYKTRKKEYILNIIMAIGFALWILVPFYTKYYDWEESQRQGVNVKCINENNATYCKCMDNMVFKHYDFTEYEKIDTKTNTKYLKFIKESEEDCFGDSWF